MPIIIKKAGFEDLLNSGDYYLKALIIGENGAGKTPFAAQWPQPLFALCENGHMSLALSGTPYADITNSTDMDQLLALAKAESRKPAASRKFQTFVVDTIDSYQKILIQERLRITKAAGLSGWDDWGWLEAKMAALIEGLKSLAMHTVVLMHTKDVVEETEGEGTKVTQRARMKGDIKESVYDNFPLIGLVEGSYGAGEGEQKGQRVLKRHVRWQADPKHPILRDQSTRLPKTTPVNFEQSDFQQIFDAISGGLDEYGKSEVIEEIETPEDTAATPPESVDEVGPLSDPALPRPAAKKTAAKKTAAKKAAAKPPATDVPTDPSPAPGPTADAGEATTTDDPWQPPLDHEKPAAEPKAEEPKAEPEAPKTEAPKAPAGNGHICGSQPSAFVGKYEAKPGCGNPIASDDVASRVGLVKHRTYLCGECIAKQA